MVRPRPPKTSHKLTIPQLHDSICTGERVRTTTWHYVRSIRACMRCCEVADGILPEVRFTYVTHGLVLS